MAEPRHACVCPHPDGPRRTTAGSDHPLNPIPTRPPSGVRHRQTEQAVSDALAAGYRLLDTAAAYGNEEAVGRATKNSGIPRGELFVTTKLWVQDAPAQDDARRAFETSLTKLGLDHLDLYLMHHPFGDVYGQWRAMEAVNRDRAWSRRSASPTSTPTGSWT